MKAIEFDKLKKQYEPKKLIYMYIDGKIDLTGKQIDELIEMKRKAGRY